MSTLPLFPMPEGEEDARFVLELKGDVAGVFQQARGLKPEREITYVDEGGRRFAVARIGPFAKGHIVLELGTCDVRDLFDWFVASRDQDAFAESRKNGDVIYLDPEGEVRYRWRFKNARITEWLGPNDPPKAGELYFVDKVGISHEGLEPADP